MFRLKDYLQKYGLDFGKRLNINPENLVFWFHKIINPSINVRIKSNQAVIKAFASLFYNQGKIGGSWYNTFWFGVRALKSPLDLWVYQEIIFETKPTLIIETGTAYGGSGLFLANIFDLVGKGRILTVDTNKFNRPKHPRIKFYQGSSTDSKIFGQIKKEINKKDRVMVILDSDHSRDHVTKELEFYCGLVSRGCYLIVEDTNVNGHPVFPKHGPGPYEAVSEFLKKHNQFKIDETRQKYLITSNPNGFLKKI